MHKYTIISTPSLQSHIVQMGLQWAMAYYRVVGPSYLSLLVFILNGVLLFVSQNK
jgi:hypothetical protein